MKFRTIAVSAAAAAISLGGPARADMSPRAAAVAPILGKWSIQGDSFPTVLGRASHFTGTIDCKRSPSGFGIVCDGKETSAGSSSSATTVTVYDEAAKAYDVVTFTNGLVIKGKMTVAGNAWTTISSVGGLTRRITTTFVGDTSTSRSEISQDGGKTYVPLSDSAQMRTSPG